MRVVVIGGSGHIGTYLVPMLVERGHEVINVTRGERAPCHPMRHVGGEELGKEREDVEAHCRGSLEGRQDLVVQAPIDLDAPLGEVDFVDVGGHEGNEAFALVLGTRVGRGDAQHAVRPGVQQVGDRAECLAFVDAAENPDGVGFLALGHERALTRSPAIQVGLDVGF